MSHDARTMHTGQVTDVFAHRFVVKTATGKILADLGPKGTERMLVREGDHVEMSGETKPSELKVHRIARNGAQPVIIEHERPQTEEHAEADPAPALRTVETNGFTVLGVPRRKPKHFEILGRDKAGDLVEMHVELDGTLRNTKPVDEEDGKWKAEIAQSA